MTKKGTVFCDYCERAYLPANSTAENSEIYCSQACFCDYCERAYLPANSTAENSEVYCSQACENSDGLEDSEESDE